MADYRKNPDAFDNKGVLKKAKNQEERDRIIRGRVWKLEKEIRDFEKNIDKEWRKLHELTGR